MLPRRFGPNVLTSYLSTVVSTVQVLVITPVIVHGLGAERYGIWSLVVSLGVFTILLDMGLAGGWKGYYEVTPDHNALVGEDPNVRRLVYATGFSGHGFLQGPAVGEIVRDLVLGCEPFVDIAPLAAERFEGGTLRPERNVI